MIPSVDGAVAPYLDSSGFTDPGLGVMTHIIVVPVMLVTEN